MCGITGFLDISCILGREELRARVGQMADTLRHRGPDDGGVWVDPEVGLALGHRRLAILDLSPAGRQPMHSVCGRYVITFNGEVYNFQALRRELQQERQDDALTFRGHSDTEVLLAAISQWGLKIALNRLNGMFAFALWDRQERVLYLVRDRLGKKPLYYGWMGSTFLFGSELKALRAHPSFKNEINRDAVAEYLRLGYIPSPHCVYKNIHKLSPGEFLIVPFGENQTHLSPIPYWSAKEVAEQAIVAPFGGSPQEAQLQLEALLREAVQLRMIADVPLGAFLSGGIDSSTVVALMQAQCARPVRTFTIGFHETGYNEAEHAKRLACHLGTDHTELYVTPKDAMAVIPRLPSLYDEPFADPSQIPTFLVSQLTRQHVTVSLSGDGGDEIFAGYGRYLTGKDIWQKMQRTPNFLRKLTAKTITRFSPQIWNAVIRMLTPVLQGRITLTYAGDTIHRLARMMVADTPESMYLEALSHLKHPANQVLGARELPTAFSDPARFATLPDITQRMMYLDMVTYLPDDILTKVDRASMGVSLEVRNPLLDHRVVEFALRLPLSLKIRDGQGKWLLRQVLYQYVPQQLIERPKMGFGVPIDAWLRGPLREWAQALLDEQQLHQQGIFKPKPIQEKWSAHLTGKQDWQSHLWAVLMFEAWLHEQ